MRAVDLEWLLSSTRSSVEPERSVHITNVGCSSRRSPGRTFLERGAARPPSGLVRRSS